MYRFHHAVARSAGSAPGSLQKVQGHGGGCFKQMVEESEKVEKTLQSEGGDPKI